MLRYLPTLSGVFRENMKTIYATHSGFFRSNKIHGWHHGRKLGQFYNLLLSPLFFFFLNPFSRFVSTWFPICLNDTNVLPNPISLCFTLSLSYSLSQLQPLSLSVTPSLSYTLSLLHPLSLTPSLSLSLTQTPGRYIAYLTLTLTKHSHIQPHVRTSQNIA